MNPTTRNSRVGYGGRMTTTLLAGRIGSVYWGLEWKLADMWIGVFWRRLVWSRGVSWDVWICFLPCLPLHLSWGHANGGTDD